MWAEQGSYVVRYGEDTSTPHELRERALAHCRKIYAKDGRCEYGISVHVGPPGCSPDEVAALGQRPNPKYRYTTLRAIREAGFEVSCEMDDYGHTNVFLPNPPSGVDCARLSDLFTYLRNNPQRTPLHLRVRPGSR